MTHILFFIKLIVATLIIPVIYLLIKESQGFTISV